MKRQHQCIVDFTAVMSAPVVTYCPLVVKNESDESGC